MLLCSAALQQGMLVSRPAARDAFTCQARQAGACAHSQQGYSVCREETSVKTSAGRRTNTQDGLCQVHARCQALVPRGPRLHGRHIGRHTAREETARGGRITSSSTSHLKSSSCPLHTTPMQCEQGTNQCRMPCRASPAAAAPAAWQAQAPPTLEGTCPYASPQGGRWLVQQWLIGGGARA